MQHWGKWTCFVGGQGAWVSGCFTARLSDALPGYGTIVTQSDRIGGAFTPAIASYRSARGPLVHQV